jgi:hypothetical protein
LHLSSLERGSRWLEAVGEWGRFHHGKWRFNRGKWQVKHNSWDLNKSNEGFAMENFYTEAEIADSWGII